MPTILFDCEVYWKNYILAFQQHFSVTWICLFDSSRFFLHNRNIQNPGQDLCSPGGIWQCLETFLLASTWREGSCYWHLVGRNQECCFISYNTENSSPQQKLTSPEIPTVLRLNSPKMERGTHFYQRLPIDALEILFQKKINTTFKHTFSDVINRLHTMVIFCSESGTQLLITLPSASICGATSENMSI